MVPDVSPVKPTLLVGLGNPGAQYDRTRHNIGFEVVDTLSQRWGVACAPQKKFQGAYGEGFATGCGKVRLLKPSTFMNQSGQSIRSVLDWYKLAPEQVLIIYDDMDLPLGRLRLRLSGSAGGHNGMKSAIAHLGTQQFPRLRVGIGTPRRGDRKAETVSHVLGKFAPDEAGLVRDILALCVETVECGLRDGVAKAMSLYNNRDLAAPDMEVQMEVQTGEGRAV
ncbi:aminoacyl-tRNA hydrolase [Prochlorothrix hollandica]|uniref:Peptidyl-tRNA hydrolase n=1 Tax=Prochlorothrix hollandica PCC 9006 = CALU 1027 TaxID=317619 RepID=A0A0M2PYU7_PROHO|nr:aminoacyl-tRNA hydrolase [Prochlorothrix hollandica]KKJ01315.1 peptidyl-tRNA hydrolase [Prochlorothrix hollandica PCC 9006 = CALU 1027]